MLFMPRFNKILFIFCVLFYANLLFFPKTSFATVYNISADCSALVYTAPPVIAHCLNTFMDADETSIDCGGLDCPACPLPPYYDSCDVFNDTNLNSSNLVSVIITADNFNDSGGIRITGPLATNQIHNGPWAVGTNITAWFGFDGAGVYTVRTFATDAACCSLSGSINLQVTTQELSVSAAPLFVTSGVATAVEFTVTSSAGLVSGADVNLSGGFVGSCTTVATGKCSITVTAAANVTATASKLGYANGVATILIIPPPGACTANVSFKGGLVPCGRYEDNLGTIWNEEESCNLCHVIPLANNIIDYLVGLVGVITVLFIAIGGLMSVTSLGGSSGLTTVKMAISKSVLGFVFVLVAWVIVNLFMTVFGFIDPMGDGSWRKFNCNLNTVPSFCGDGIVNGLEKCEPGITPPLVCATTFSSGACADIPVSGTQTCNSCCDWDPCTADPPTVVGGSSSACASTSPALNDFACCELTGCGVDGCGCCGRAWGAAVPGGYTLIQSLSPCGGGDNSCRLSQSNANLRDWMVTTEHTTAYYQCYE